MGIVEIIALSMGIAWASGINLYAALATLGILANSGHLALPPDLLILADPLVIGAALFMYCVEFFADKVPGVDSTWDTLHTFIRIPAAAVLAAGALGELSPVAQLAAAIVGGGLAASSHTMKAGTRLLINTSPEPFSNIGASITEDVLVIGGVCLAVTYPVATLVLLFGFVAVSIWLLPKLWRLARTLLTRLRAFFAGGGRERSTASEFQQATEAALHAMDRRPRLEHKG